MGNSSLCIFIIFDSRGREKLWSETISKSIFSTISVARPMYLFGTNFLKVMKSSIIELQYFFSCVFRWLMNNVFYALCVHCLFNVSKITNDTRNFSRISMNSNDVHVNIDTFSIRLEYRKIPYYFVFSFSCLGSFSLYSFVLWPLHDFTLRAIFSHSIPRLSSLLVSPSLSFHFSSSAPSINSRSVLSQPRFSQL